jgi:glycerol-3-phosphate dehydrogenase (NAD(P)+)
VGYGLAQGKSLAEVLATLQGTAEGINTAQVLVKLAELRGIDAPISQLVDRLLKGKITAIAALEALMTRDFKPEVD